MHYNDLERRPLRFSVSVSVSTVRLPQTLDFVWGETTKGDEQGPQKWCMI